MINYWLFTSVLISSIPMPSIAQNDNALITEATITSVDSTSIFGLAALINQRLSYMKDVAAYKWVNQIPIEDLEREKIVLDNSLKKAKTYQLDTNLTRDFFIQQMEAAKQIQQFWFNEWKNNGFPDNYVYQDLRTEVRPALLDLGDQILTTFKELTNHHSSSNQFSGKQKLFKKQLNTPGLNRINKNRITRSAKKVRRFASK